MAIKSEPVKDIRTGINTIYDTCTWCAQPHSYFPKNGVCAKCGRV